MTDANSCSICGKSKVADPASPEAHCKGHADTGASMKAQLDAIKAPGSPAAAGSKPSPPPVPAPKPASSQQNMKSALDAIPTPGAKAAPAPVPAPGAAKAEPSIADQLNAIPTPGQKPAASITKSQLDAIPTPGAAAKTPEAPAAPAAPAAGSMSFADQLNAIPTPGVGNPASISATDLNSIPTPGSRPPSAPAKPPGEQPQWMKNYNTYQSAMTSSSASGLPVQDPNANYQFQNRDLPANNNSGYMMIAALVVVIALAFFGFQMMSKTAPPDFNSIGSGTATGTTTGSPSSSLPGTPVTQPQPQPFTPQQPVISQPVGGYTPPPPTEPSVVQP